MNKHPEELYHKCAELYAKGMKYEEIARYLGLSSRNVVAGLLDRGRHRITVIEEPRKEEPRKVDSVMIQSKTFTVPFSVNGYIYPSGEYTWVEGSFARSLYDAAFGNALGMIMDEWNRKGAK